MRPDARPQWPQRGIGPRSFPAVLLTIRSATCCTVSCDQRHIATNLRNPPDIPINSRKTGTNDLRFLFALLPVTLKMYFISSQAPEGYCRTAPRPCATDAQEM